MNHFNIALSILFVLCLMGCAPSEAREDAYGSPPRLTHPEKLTPQERKEAIVDLRSKINQAVAKGSYWHSHGVAVDLLNHQIQVQELGVPHSEKLLRMAITEAKDAEQRSLSFLGKGCTFDASFATLPIKAFAEVFKGYPAFDRRDLLLRVERAHALNPQYAGDAQGRDRPLSDDEYRRHMGCV